jgi:hypothetical protein
MPDFDSTQWVIFIAGAFVTVVSTSMLILALYFKITSRDDIDNTGELSGSELAVSRRRRQNFR